MKKWLLFFLLLLIAVTVLILMVLPYELVGSPKTVLSVVNENNQSVPGIRVVREWNTSEKKQGISETVTDSNGEAHFDRIAFHHMTWLTHIFKWFLIFIPANSSSNWEVYGNTEFRIFWPEGYTINLDEKEWKRIGDVYQRSDGLMIRDPVITNEYSNQNCLELLLSNKKRDFSYKIVLIKK